jgi:sulfite reductase beta subunit-like hemoprotein
MTEPITFLEPEGSKAEAVKRRSKLLRGTLREELDNGSDRFKGDSPALLKFHGMYQQENRDERKLKEKAERTVRVMVRSRIPGGLLTGAQWRAYGKLADRFGDRTLRITARQSIQLHGIVKSGVKRTLQEIHEALLTTTGACGDLVRNVMVTPDPAPRPALAQLRRAAVELSDRFRPRSGAYAEVFLDGKPADPALPAEEQEQEPLYGPAYLPRKFKMGMTLAGDNSIDAYTQDLAFIAVTDAEDRIAGYNVLAGGGMGKTHRHPRTFPRLADEIAFISPEDLVPVADAVVGIHRDFGDRVDRKHARLKYVLEERGLAWFRAELMRRGGVALAPYRPMHLDIPYWYGWHAMAGGRWSLGIPVLSGRVRDDGAVRMRTFLDRVAERPGVKLQLTPQQHVLIFDIPGPDRAEVDRLREEHGVPAGPKLDLRTQALACPAMPTCSLALSEAERFLPELLANLNTALTESHPAAAHAPLLRVTGCPNGCVRPYTAEIGVVGQGPRNYALYLGGNRAGTRLAREFQDNVPAARLGPVLAELFALWAAEAPGADFGDFVDSRWEGLQGLKALSA